MLAIFIVEADNKSKSDFIYISKYVRHFFTIGKQDVIRSVCLGGKGNYKKNSKVNIPRPEHHQSAIEHRHSAISTA